MLASVSPLDTVYSPDDPDDPDDCSVVCPVVGVAGSEPDAWGDCPVVGAAESEEVEACGACPVVGVAGSEVEAWGAVWAGAVLTGGGAACGVVCCAAVGDCGACAVSCSFPQAATVSIIAMGTKCFMIWVLSISGRLH